MGNLFLLKKLPARIVSFASTLEMRSVQNRYGRPMDTVKECLIQMSAIVHCLQKELFDELMIVEEEEDAPAKEIRKRELTLHLRDVEDCQQAIERACELLGLVIE